MAAAPLFAFVLAFLPELRGLAANVFRDEHSTSQQTILDCLTTLVGEHSRKPLEPSEKEAALTLLFGVVNGIAEFTKAPWVADIWSQASQKYGVGDSPILFSGMKTSFAGAARSTSAIWARGTTKWTDKTEIKEEDCYCDRRDQCISMSITAIICGHEENIDTSEALRAIILARKIFEATAILIVDDRSFSENPLSISLIVICIVGYLRKISGETLKNALSIAAASPMLLCYTPYDIIPAAIEFGLIAIARASSGEEAASSCDILNKPLPSNTFPTHIDAPASWEECTEEFRQLTREFVPLSNLDKFLSLLNEVRNGERVSLRDLLNPLAGPF